MVSAGTRTRFGSNITDPCADVTPQAGVTGPLAAGQTFVNVAGVSAGATNVTVYANAAQIGITNNAAGFAAGTLQVTTSALVKGNGITATQIKLNPARRPLPQRPGQLPPSSAADLMQPLTSSSQASTKLRPATGPIGADGTAVGYAYSMPCTYLELWPASRGWTRTLPS